MEKAPCLTGREPCLGGKHAIKPDRSPSLGGSRSQWPEASPPVLVPLAVRRQEIEAADQAQLAQIRAELREYHPRILTPEDLSFQANDWLTALGLLVQAVMAI
jgi:hypothetical protein